jgi:hypothetical protein
MKTIRHLLATAALGLLTFTASAQSWVTNGLVAYYPFNGNANDASGNGNNGINQGGAYQYSANSSINYSLVLTNINVINPAPSYSSCLRADIPAAVIPTTAGTISAWILPYTITNRALKKPCF